MGLRRCCIAVLYGVTWRTLRRGTGSGFRLGIRHRVVARGAAAVVLPPTTGARSQRSKLTIPMAVKPAAKLVRNWRTTVPLGNPRIRTTPYAAALLDVVSAPFVRDDACAARADCAV
jgi:hypothetical protein